MIFVSNQSSEHALCRRTTFARARLASNAKTSGRSNNNTPCPSAFHLRPLHWCDSLLPGFVWSGASARLRRALTLKRPRPPAEVKNEPHRSATSRRRSAGAETLHHCALVDCRCHLPCSPSLSPSLLLVKCGRAHLSRALVATTMPFW